MGNVVMEATQINYRRDETLKTVDQKLQELSQESAIDTDIAPVFKSNITYHPGDLVYYRNKLYVFTAEHTGAWSAGDVTATDVSTAMNTALAGKADYADIAGAFSAETAYTAGDMVIYNGIIYRCTNDHTGDWDADDFSATTIGAELNAINSNISTLSSNINRFTRAFVSDSSHWYRIATYSVSQMMWFQRLFLIAFNGAAIKAVTLRCTPTDGFDNNDNKVEQIVGTTQRLGLKVSDDKLSISVYIKNGLSGTATYTILSDMGESSRINFTEPVQTDVTTEEMDVVN